MEISLNNLLSSLTSAPNKEAKEVLANVKLKDEQGLKIPIEAQIKKSASDVLNSLFKDLSTESKSKQSVLNILKDSNIPKSMQSTTTELKSLLTLVKSDSALEKFAPILEKLLVHVKELDAKSLKAQVSASGVFLESKLANKTSTLPLPMKEILLSLKQTLSQNGQSSGPLGALIDKILSAPVADKSFINDIKTLLTFLKGSKSVNKPIIDITAKLETLVKDSQLIESKLANKTSTLPLPMKEILLSLKQTLSQSGQSSGPNSALIDKILSTPVADKSFINDIKTLLTFLKGSKSVNKPVIDITAKLETLVKDSQLIESKMQTSPNALPKEIAKTVNEIKFAMNELKQLAISSSSKKAPAVMEKAEVILKLVAQTQSMTNFFPNDLPKMTISQQLQRVVNLLKIELTASDSKSGLHVELSKLTEKLELSVKSEIAAKTLVPNQKLQGETPIKQEIANDIKATLLSMKKELSSSTLPVSKEALAQVDKLLGQIDYYQLLSYSSNSNSLYLPFLWEGLEEGQLSLKKLKENRFFCEINLQLKEYGKIDLMIMLFDDIHINMSVFAQKEEFLDLVRENLKELKVGLNKLGLIPSNIKLFDAKKDEQIKNDTRVFVDSNQLGAGINLHI